MGLDMYLEKRTFIGNQYKEHEEKEMIDLKIPLDCKDEAIKSIKKGRISYVLESVGYWRKANQIHKWFVDNVQDGNDNCRSYYVDEKNLKELLDVCKKVVENHALAAELLPVSEGFFFGGREYDEYYFKDLEYTIKLIEELLKEGNNDGIYYQSSW